MGTTYTVTDGDTMSQIAVDHGFSDWRVIWDDPANAGLRAQRPDPDKIFPGDQVFIPDNPSAAPLFTVTFQVTDNDSGAPLVGATVEITGILRERTDSTGSFSTTQLKPGVSCDLKVSMDGFRNTFEETGIFWYHAWSARAESGEGSLRTPVKDATGNDTSTFGIVFSTSRTSYAVKLRRDWRFIPVAGAPGTTVTVDGAVKDTEVVLVAGSDQHERTVGNAMRFPAQAVRELRQNFATEKHVAILVFKQGYTDDMIQAITDAAAKWNPGAKVVKLASKDDLLNYINSGDTAAGTPHRHQAAHGIPIKALEFFSHGIASTFRFDMDGPDDAACSLGLGDVASFDKASFMPDATVTAFSCRIGNSSTTEVLADPSKWRDEAKPENSLAQKLAEQLNLSVHGYILRTDYAATWSQDGVASVVSANVRLSDPFPHQGFHPFDKNDALWNPEGAHKPVVAGTTPSWLDQPDTKCRFLFKPGATPAADGAP